MSASPGRSRGWCRANASFRSALSNLAGPPSTTLCSAFTMPRAGEILFQLVADRIDSHPTLTHEPEVTAKLRDEARAG